MSTTVSPQDSAPLSREDYTIGWISALSIELAAAAEMLDQEHDPLPVASGDSNSYILGQIGRHNVVMTGINEAGGLPASMVATNLMKSFTNVRYILMVGIGGGIPTKEYQIRLGDVVISKPKGKFPGVVQSDLGKWETDGFKIMGSLNRPAEGLMRAVLQLEVLQLRNRSKIHVFVKHFRGRVRDPDKWKYQGRENDPIYKDEAGLRQDGVCSECAAMAHPDQQQHTPDPMIHYGIIASGNQVIKNREQRDKLRDQLDACCVEMEAFGLMNNFPCLVIRGISDYADGQKNDIWQQYAALTAAACAKELLLHLPSVEGTPRMSDQIKQLENKIVVMEANLATANRSLEGRERQRILDWLSPDYHTSSHSAILNKVERFHDPGSWITEEGPFRTWAREKSSSILWIRGDVGTGKTIIMYRSTIVAKLSNHGQGVVAYFYCSAGAGQDKSLKDPHKVLRSIVRQFAARKMINEVRSVYERREQEDLSTDQTKSLLADLVREFGSATVIIDALDELEEPKVLIGSLQDILQKCKNGNGTIKILVSGRDEFSTQYLRRWPYITIEPDSTQSEIELLIEKELESIPTERASDESKIMVFDKLKENASGRFRWVELSLKWIFDSRRAPSWIVRNIDKLPDTVTDLYMKLLEEIDRDLKENRLLAYRTIMWLLCAQRPLSAMEMKDAICFGSLWKPQTLELDTVLYCCHHLVIFDKESESFTFGHVSVTQFIQEVQTRKKYQNKFGNVKSNKLAAELCLSLCGANIMPSGADPNQDADLTRNAPTLKEYASTYWPNHYSIVAQSHKGRANHYIRLFDDHGNWFDSWCKKLPELASSCPNYTQRRKLDDSNSSPSDHVFVCCAFGIPNHFDRAVSPTFNDIGRTCLHVACLYDHVAVVKSLLSKGASVEWRDRDGTAAGVTAAREAGPDIVKLFINNRDITDQVTDMVKAAIENRKSGREVLKVLLQKNWGKYNYITENIIAAIAKNFDEEIMRLLLDQGAGDGKITASIFKAAASNSACGEDIMMCLIDRQELEISEGAVQAIAGEWDSGKLMKMLLDKRERDVQITEDILKAAANNESGGKEVLALLLAQRRDIEITEDIVKAAAGNKKAGEETVALLLDYQDKELPVTEDVLKAAVHNRERGKQVLALLLCRREDIKITEEVVREVVGDEQNGAELLEVLLDHRGDSLVSENMLLTIVEYAYKQPLAALLNQRENIQITEKMLKAAAGNRSSPTGVVSLLLDHGGDASEITEEVLVAAARNGLHGTDVMSVLLDRGGEDLQITEGVVAAAMENWRGERLMTMLLDRRETEIPITAEVIKAAGRSRMTLWDSLRGDDPTIERYLILIAAIYGLRGEEAMEPILGPLVGTDWTKRQAGRLWMLQAGEAGEYIGAKGSAIGPLLHRRPQDVRAAVAQWRWHREIKALLDGEEDLEVTERTKVALAKYLDEKVLSLLLDRYGEDSLVTEDVVVAAAENWRSGEEVMSVLLDRFGDIQVTDTVLAAAAANGWSGREVLTLLLERCGGDNNIWVTGKVVKAASRNRRNGYETLVFLLQQEKVQIMEDAVKEVAWSWSGKHASALLHDWKCSDAEEVAGKKAELGLSISNGLMGKELMRFLLREREDVLISEGVVAAVAREFDEEVMATLLDREEDVLITGEVVRAAAESWRTKSVRVRLVDGYRGHDFVYGACGKRVMALLIRGDKERVHLSEEAVVAIAHEFDEELMALLLEQRGDDMQIGEAVLVAIASNQQSGKEIMTLLLDHPGVDVQITADVVIAATENPGCGTALISVLIERGVLQMHLAQAMLVRRRIMQRLGLTSGGFEFVGLLASLAVSLAVWTMLTWFGAFLRWWTTVI